MHSTASKALVSAWVLFIDFHPQVKMLSPATPQPTPNNVKFCLGKSFF